jgi:hypothetical protein
MSRQVPHAEDTATGTPTAGLVPVSAGPGLAPAWGAGGGGGGSPDFVKLVEVGPLSSSQAAITLPASGVFPTGYRSYEVRGRLLGQFASTQALFQINGDTGSNYDWQRNRWDGTGSQSSDAFNGDANIRGPYLIGPTLYSTSNLSVDFQMRINLPEATNTWKNVDWWTDSWLGIAAGSAGSSQMTRTMGRWRDLSAITSLTFTIDDASLFQPGSWMAVYGIK